MRAAQNPHYSYPPLMFIHPDQAHVHTARLCLDVAARNDSPTKSSPTQIFSPRGARAHCYYDNHGRVADAACWHWQAGVSVWQLSRHAVFLGHATTRQGSHHLRASHLKVGHRPCAGAAAGFICGLLGRHHRSSAVRHPRSPRPRPSTACVLCPGYCSGCVPCFRGGVRARARSKASSCSSYAPIRD